MVGRKMIAVLFGVAAMFWVIGLVIFSPFQSSSTNDKYLIPEGFEGDIQVNYNVQGAPALEKEGKYDIIPIREDGTYDTSKPEMEYGMVTDQYFYVDSEGRRTPIDVRCIYVGGNGSSEVGSTIIHHTYLKVTRTKCSDDYRAWGS
jgi:hypothetical protein